MDITRENFSEALSLFKDSLNDCDFCAVDVEFSGIRTQGVDVSGCDIPEVRYHKLRSVVQSYGILQIGFCLFRRVSNKTNVLEPRPFNIWTLPQDIHVKGKTKCFSRPSSWKMDAAAIHFLRETGFNFTQCFTRGVSYADSNVEKSLDSFLSSSDFHGTSSEKDQIRQSVLGVRQFWSALVSSGVPLVLHNASFDFLFLMNYLEAPLPPSLSEFLALKARRAPAIIFDTKVLALDLYPNLPVEASLEVLCRDLLPKAPPPTLSPSSAQQQQQQQQQSSNILSSTAAATPSKSLNVAAPSFKPSSFKADAPSFFPSYAPPSPHDHSFSSFANPSLCPPPPHQTSSKSTFPSPSANLNHLMIPPHSPSIPGGVSSPCVMHSLPLDFFEADSLLNLQPSPAPFTKYQNNSFCGKLTSENLCSHPNNNFSSSSSTNENPLKSLDNFSITCGDPSNLPPSPLPFLPTYDPLCFQKSHQPHNNNNNNYGMGYYHEAAFDALQTGRLLLAIKLLAGSKFADLICRLAGHIHLKRCVWTMNTLAYLQPVYKAIECESTLSAPDALANSEGNRPVFDAALLPPAVQVNLPSPLPSLYSILPPTMLAPIIPPCASTEDLLVLKSSCAVSALPWASPLALVCLVDVQPGLRTSGVLDALDIQFEPPPSPTSAGTSSNSLLCALPSCSINNSTYGTNSSGLCAPGGASARIQIRWGNDFKSAIVSSSSVFDLEERLLKLAQQSAPNGGAAGAMPATNTGMSYNLAAAGCATGTLLSANALSLNIPAASANSSGSSLLSGSKNRPDQWPSLSSLASTPLVKAEKKAVTAANAAANAVPSQTLSSGNLPSNKLFEVQDINDFLFKQRILLEETTGVPGVAGVSSFLTPVAAPAVPAPLLVSLQQSGKTSSGSINNPSSSLQQSVSVSCTSSSSLQMNSNLNVQQQSAQNFLNGGGYRKPFHTPSPVIVAKTRNNLTNSFTSTTPANVNNSSSNIQTSPSTQNINNNLFASASNASATLTTNTNSFSSSNPSSNNQQSLSSYNISSSNFQTGGYKNVGGYSGGNNTSNVTQSGSSYNTAFPQLTSNNSSSVGQNVNTTTTNGYSGYQNNMGNACNVGYGRGGNSGRGGRKF